ncbi:DUF881 domain-containing protein [Isoptericola sp. 4D.3]|uniref:DUF881 domain-containing protein n=1 Tax=Isoptericola peretonis TaxID=2918523 RepID=A0ABT0J256_9MICO|nr:DUF881 domain-containing protein [Isoptericola sp. 4D.3]
MSDHTGDRPDVPDEERADAARPEPEDATVLDESTGPDGEAGKDADTAQDAEEVTPEVTSEVTESADVPVLPEDVEGTDDAEATGTLEGSEAAGETHEPDEVAPVHEQQEDSTGDIAAAEDVTPAGERDDDEVPAGPGATESSDEGEAHDGTGEPSEPEAPAGAPVTAHDATEDAPGGPEPTTGPSGWRRLGAALRPRATRSQVLAGVLCAALGFALVVQVQQSASDQLSSARQEDLVRLLDEVTDRAQQLGDEVAGLETTRDELRSGSGQAQSALELAQQRAESEGILSGRLPAQGPGVEITVEDPAAVLKASQMFNVLEELRNAGAEVVELNDVRLVTSTWFEDEGDAIVVDGTTLSSPYEWTVIGDPETMDRALEIPGGALATVRTAGAEATTTQQDDVSITAVTPPQEPEYAEPERERG